MCKLKSKHSSTSGVEAKANTCWYSSIVKLSCIKSHDYTKEKSRTYLQWLQGAIGIPSDPMKMNYEQADEFLTNIKKKKTNAVQTIILEL